MRRRAVPCPSARTRRDRAGSSCARCARDAGLFGPTVLCGVAVTMPTANTPRALRRGVLLVGSVAPYLWRLPHIRGLDLDGFPERYPRAYARMAGELGRRDGNL